MNMFNIARLEQAEIRKVFKNKLSISLFTILLFSLNTAHCQNEALVLTKNSNEKEKVVEQGEKIKIWTNKGETYKGYFSLKGDSIVIQDKCCIAIADVAAIRSKHAGSYFLGGAVIGLGLIVSALAGNLLAIIIDAGGLAYYGMIIAAPLTAGALAITTGGILIIVNGAKYKSSKWSYSATTIVDKV